MNQYLRSLGPTGQVHALFLVLFGLLALITAVVLAQSLRPRPDTPGHRARRLEWQRTGAMVRTSWLMAVVFWVGWLLGHGAATALFGLVSFFVLREFVTLSPTRRGDHRSLVLAFFVVLPLQFWLVATRRFDLFTVFIPVYVFLALPVASALAGDTERFLERTAKMQWGIMVCVYGLSHVPALLLLDFPRYGGRGAFLVFYLVFVVQSGLLVQHLAGRLLHRPPAAPQVSLSFQWQAWALGLAAAGVLGGLLSFITPFKPGQSLAMALLAAFAATLGHLVMKALKRDRGVASWGLQGLPAGGAGGLLDRVDGLCFAAPVFFHSARWYFGA
jgi:phosphatidate cytidylyltransferase